MSRVTLSSDATAADRANAAEVLAPWSSDPLDECEWREEPDGSVTIYRSN